MDALASSLREQLSVVEHEPGLRYSSKHRPFRIGNTAPISYGGFQLGIAVNAALQTVPAEHYLYSITGNYVAAVSTESRITCAVETIRSTRTFSTRALRVHQEQGNGKPPRLCLLATADFHAPEPSVLKFSPAPSRTYSHWRECLESKDDIRSRLVAEGHLSERHAKRLLELFGPMEYYFPSAPCPEGISAQNLNGAAAAVATTQDHLKPSEKSSAEWIRSRDERTSDGREQAVLLAFRMDAGTSFLPVVHDHLFLDDVGACSSLDFALRIFANDIDLSQWHLSERRSLCANLGLTYSIANMWDEGGQLIASMSQQCILRAKPSETGKL